jgi:hypothetical protein
VARRWHSGPEDLHTWRSLPSGPFSWKLQTFTVVSPLVASNSPCMSQASALGLDGNPRSSESFTSQNASTKAVVPEDTRRAYLSWGERLSIC